MNQGHCSRSASCRPASAAPTPRRTGRSPGPKARCACDHSLPARRHAGHRRSHAGAAPAASRLGQTIRGRESSAGGNGTIGGASAVAKASRRRLHPAVQRQHLHHRAADDCQVRALQHADRLHRDQPGGARRLSLYRDQQEPADHGSSRACLPHAKAQPWQTRTSPLARPASAGHLCDRAGSSARVAAISLIVPYKGSTPAYQGPDWRLRLPVLSTRCWARQCNTHKAG